jgi:predicted RNA-binding Zn ribbon-like protein
MTGENGRWRVLASVQPGGRPAAPGELALVQSFINSHYDLVVDHGAELLATPHSLGAWLLARGLIGARTRVVEEDLERALAIREGLRTMARSDGGGEAAGETLRKLNRAARGAAAEIRFANDGPQLVLHGRGEVAAALGLVLAIAGRAMIDGSWSRLKVCPGEDCDWAFYDNSRNQTGRWCSMSVCGARAKARAHYHRRRRGGDPLREDDPLREGDPLREDDPLRADDPLRGGG